MAFLSCHRTKVLSLYKEFFRTQARVFENDLSLQKAAKQRIRQEFRAHINERDPKEIENLLKTAQFNLDFLQKNIVQGVLKDGRYGRKNDQIYSTILI